MSSSAISRARADRPAAPRAGAGAPVSVEEVAAGSAGEALEKAWRELASGESAFVQPSWVKNWARSFASEDPRLILVSEGFRLDGLIPLVRRPMRWRRIEARALCLPVNNHAPMSDLLLAGGGRAAAAVLAHLLRRRDWDLLVLQNVQTPGRLDALARAAAASGLRVLRRRLGRHVLPLGGTWEEYLAARSKELRRALRRTRLGLERLGPVRLRVYEGAEAGEGFERFLDADACSWKGREGEPVGADPGLCAYYRGLVMGAAAEGRCEVCILEAGDTSAAGLIALLSPRREYLTLKCSYRDDLASGTVSPGTLVVAGAIERAWSRGCARVDFLSRMPYAGRWATELDWTGDLVVFSSTLRGRAIAMIDSMARRLRPNPDGGWEEVIDERHDASAQAEPAIG